jgi:polyhydroxybutyrate depolymerase
VSGSLNYQGRSRAYLIHVPPSYDGSRPLPLVLILHGGMGNAAGTEKLTGLSAKADKEGFIAVYPNGTGLLGDRILTWNVGWGYGYALRNNVNDVGFLKALVANLENRYSIDRNRVYATGISNGAMMSYRLASEASDVFAAVAPVSGAAAGQKNASSPLVVFPAPARPVSVIAFNGRMDRMVPYDGGQGMGVTNAVYQPVSYSISNWVGFDGCPPNPTRQVSADGNVITDSYAGGRGGSEVVLVTINNGGHAWPGAAGPAWQGGDQPANDISANDVMWDFFVRHPKSS